MKLNSAQLERTLGQFEARPIPDDHPLIPQLNDLFGEHTGDQRISATMRRATHA
jgi:hypothetical protein